MVRILTVLLLALAASAQPAPFTLDQVLGFSFPSGLTAAPVGGRVAWVSNFRGVRNIMVAEAPAYKGRKITAYREDDGQEIQDLCWTPDASALVYTRGGSANPTSDPKGPSEEVWIVALDGSAPRKVGDGAAPAVSPRGDRIAFRKSGQVWLAPVDGKTGASQAFHVRGQCVGLTWSPDGARLAFTSLRGDHSFIALYDAAANSLRYLDAGADQDSNPEWSPDGRAIAFIRIRTSGVRQPREPHRAGEPWSIRTASVETGVGREIWRAHDGPGSVFRDVNARNSVLWADGGRIVFPWEEDGWTHLYSIAAEGGKPTLLTPGAFEVEDAALTPSRRAVLYSSNQGDIDRRHIWEVPVAGGTPVPQSAGQGIECSPVETADGAALALLRADARHPVHPVIRIGATFQDLDPEAMPAGFPVQRMVEPQQVIFSSADGLTLHGQLFLPPNQSEGTRAPAVVFFHGGSRRQMLLGWHSMYYYSNAYAFNQYLANSGYVVLSVNYRSGIGYGLDFREAVNYGASGGSEYNDVQGAGVYLRSRADVDGARIGAWGGSYGGYLTAMALARASDLFKAGVDFHGVHNWATELRIPPYEPDYKIAFESSPMAFVKTWKSPVLLIHADDDPDVQFNQTVMLADALRKQKVEMEELIIPDEVHDFLLYRTWRDGYQAAVRFLDRHLK